MIEDWQSQMSEYYRHSEPMNGQLASYPWFLLVFNHLLSIDVLVVVAFALLYLDVKFISVFLGPGDPSG